MRFCGTLMRLSCEFLHHRCEIAPQQKMMKLAPILLLLLLCEVHSEKLVSLEKDLGPDVVDQPQASLRPNSEVPKAQSAQQTLKDSVDSPDIVVPNDIGSKDASATKDKKVTFKVMIAVSPEEAERIKNSLSVQSLNSVLAASGLPSADAVSTSIVKPEDKTRVQQLSLKASTEQAGPLDQNPVAAALPSPWVRGGAAATNVADFVSVLISKGNSAQEVTPEGKDVKQGFSAGAEKAPPVSPWMRGGAAASGLSSALGWLVDKLSSK